MIFAGNVLFWAHSRAEPYFCPRLGLVGFPEKPLNRGVAVPRIGAVSDKLRHKKNSKIKDKGSKDKGTKKTSAIRSASKKDARASRPNLKKQKKHNAQQKNCKAVCEGPGKVRCEACEDGVEGSCREGPREDRCRQARREAGCGCAARGRAEEAADPASGIQDQRIRRVSGAWRRPDSCDRRAGDRRAHGSSFSSSTSSRTR